MSTPEAAVEDQSQFKGSRDHLDQLLDALRRKDSRRWDAWRKSYPAVRVNLRAMNLFGSDLRGDAVTTQIVKNLREAYFVAGDLSRE